MRVCRARKKAEECKKELDARHFRELAMAFATGGACLMLVFMAMRGGTSWGQEQAARTPAPPALLCASLAIVPRRAARPLARFREQIVFAQECRRLQRQRTENTSWWQANKKSSCRGLLVATRKVSPVEMRQLIERVVHQRSEPAFFVRTV
ncbi:hypothetical protein AK812_SmicGene35860 [Symbiodinium microadriaticum]|uniref:Uncharacterized protein n=1 Tax=Symbiodinium microadriaticum TaxID=2951 RepID=A0A1Q9CKB6_SYMMI|nr:hypothetical protein AK812_SmicGene35860 [Symbiodinium microadriaticum]